MTISGELIQNDKPNICLAVCLWGEDFLRDFQDFGLASLLAPGNLPSLAQDFSVVMAIATRPQDMVWLKKCPAILEAGKYCQFRWYFLSADSQIDKINLHHHAWWQIRHDAKHYAQFFLAVPPDTIYSDKFLSSIGNVFKAGYKVILLPFIRVMDNITDRMSPFRDGLTLNIPARTFARMILEHTVPTYGAYRPGSQWVIPHEEVIVRVVGNEGLSIQFMTDSEGFCNAITEGVHFMDNVGILDRPIPYREIFTFTDSDEIIAGSPIRIGGNGIDSSRRPRRLSALAISHWLNVFGNGGLPVLRAPIRLHRADITTRRWLRREKAASMLIAKIQAFWLAIGCWRKIATCPHLQHAAAIIAALCETRALTIALPEPPTGPFAILVPNDSALSTDFEFFRSHFTPLGIGLIANIVKAHLVPLPPEFQFESIGAAVKLTSLANTEILFMRDKFDQLTVAGKEATQIGMVEGHIIVMINKILIPIVAD